MDGQKTTFTGGLYPNSSNTRPATHETAGLAISSQILPLGVDGNPDAVKGKIVMISVGMSNTYTEFDRFQSLTQHDPEINPRLFLVNGAQDSRTSDRWIDPQAETWQLVNERMAEVGLTPKQVQVAWVKQTQTRGGDFPAKAQALQSDLEAIARNLKTNYPNIKIAYFSSRTRSYTYWRGLSPEPVAFETGFAVKWMIEKQINGDPELNYDLAKGEVKAPYLSWGSYLWIDGQNPRSDGRVWLATDLTDDCTHPSQSGSTKVAEMLLEFFKSDTTAASWFRAGVATPVLSTATFTLKPPATRTPVPRLSPQASLSPTPSSRSSETSQPGVGVETPAPGNPIQDNLPPESPIAYVAIAVLLIIGISLVIARLSRRKSSG
jgi:hypothetical protein